MSEESKIPSAEVPTIKNCNTQEAFLQAHETPGDNSMVSIMGTPLSSAKFKVQSAE